MMLAPETDPPETHPYWYARVLGIFHADVLHTGANATTRSVQQIEFLWVRWFGMAQGHRYGSAAARLPKVGFVDQVDDLAFGFLDPALVLRGCHMIPAFAGGRTLSLLSVNPTAGRLPDDDADWDAFYVNM